MHHEFAFAENIQQRLRGLLPDIVSGLSNNGQFGMKQSTEVESLSVGGWLIETDDADLLGTTNTQLMHRSKQSQCHRSIRADDRRGRVRKPKQL